MRLILSTFIKLFIGFLIVAIATVMIINSQLGLSPWYVLNQGISLITSLSIGEANVTIGVVVIVLSHIFGVELGLSTLLNVFIMGNLVDFILNKEYIPVCINPYTKIFMLISGMIFLAIGSYLYLSCELGCAPRDGLLIALSKKTKISAGYLKIVLELSVLFLGYLLGGFIGIGTLITSIGTGIFIKIIFKIFKFDEKTTKQLSLKEGITFILENLR